MTEPIREAWNFDSFVKCYDNIARERSGWRWPHEIEPAKLQQYYETSGSLWADLRDFARTRYQLDQEL